MSNEFDSAMAIGEILQLLQFQPNLEADTSNIGVKAGQGFNSGKAILIAASNPDPKENAIGKKECEVILNLLTRARRENLPVLFLWSTAGARISEGEVGLSKISEVLKEILKPRNFPIISIVLGPTAGIGSYVTTLSEFSFMVKGTQLFMTGPKVVAELTGVIETKEQTGGIKIHEKTGIPTDISQDLADLKEKLGNLLEVLIAENSVREFQYKAYFGKSIELSLKRIAGRLCGQIVLAQRLGDPSNLEVRKLNMFLRTCCNLQLPLVTHIETRGMMPGSREEESGSLFQGAELMRLMASYPAFRVAVIRGGSVAGLHLALGARGLSADYVLATPNADISGMAKSARQRFHDRPASPPWELIEEGVVDEVIPGEEIALRIESILNERT